jgi:hypothetical protein
MPKDERRGLSAVVSLSGQLPAATHKPKPSLQKFKKAINTLVRASSTSVGTWYDLCEQEQERRELDAVRTTIYDDRVEAGLAAIEWELDILGRVQAMRDGRDKKAIPMLLWEERGQGPEAWNTMWNTRYGFLPIAPALVEYVTFITGRPGAPVEMDSDSD